MGDSITDVGGFPDAIIRPRMMRGFDQVLKPGETSVKLSWATLLFVLGPMALPSVCCSHCGSTLEADLLHHGESGSRPYSASRIVLAVVDSSKWQAANESWRSDFGFGHGEAYFLHFRPILTVKGTTPLIPFWSGTGNTRYANGMCSDFGESLYLSIGDTVVTAASESLWVSSCSTVKVEVGLLGGKAVLEVINAYQGYEEQR